MVGILNIRHALSYLSTRSTALSKLKAQFGTETRSRSDEVAAQTRRRDGVDSPGAAGADPLVEGEQSDAVKLDERKRDG